MYNSYASQLRLGSSPRLRVYSSNHQLKSNAWPLWTITLVFICTLTHFLPVSETSFKLFVCVVSCFWNHWEIECSLMMCAGASGRRMEMKNRKAFNCEPIGMKEEVRLMWKLNQVDQQPIQMVQRKFYHVKVMVMVDPEAVWETIRVKPKYTWELKAPCTHTNTPWSNLHVF